MVNSKSNICINILVLILIFSCKSFAQEMPLPIENQVPLFIKILNYDRQFKTRISNSVVIGILYQNKFRASSIAKDEFIKYLFLNSENSIDGKPFSCIPIEYNNLENLEKLAGEKNLNILYVTPMRSTDIIKVSRICRENKIISISGVPEYIREGLSVGLDMKSDNPKILINLDAAKSEGADFKSQLLKISEIIKQ
jgi:hypothetical protein